MSLVINPTIGRRVLFFSGSTAGVNRPDVPFDAGIAYVHSAGSPAGQSLINVGYTDHNGVAKSQTSVVLYDRPQDTTDSHTGLYAVWMPYQFEQAQRAASPKETGGAVADVALQKLAENGTLTELGQQRVAEGVDVPHGEESGAGASQEQPATEGGASIATEQA